LALDFIGRGDTLDPRITFSRTTTGTRFNSAGTLESVAIDGPRFDYDPVTLAARGLLIEEQRTNSIRNNTGVGAVAGTPGTLPTNWTSQSVGGVALTEVVGSGVEDGIAYVDVRYTGTTSSTATGGILVEASNVTAASNGQTWAHAAYVRLIAGSLSGLSSVNMTVFGRSAAGTLLEQTNTAFTPTNALLRTQRYVATRTLNNALVAFVQPRVTLAPVSGAAIDITLRIGLPQLELGAFSTSVITTTAAAATRTADVASMTGTNFSDWYNQSEGTVYSESAVSQSGIGSITAALSDGTASNRIQIQRTAGNNYQDLIVTAGATQSSVSVSGVTANIVAKVASAYAANNFQMAANGALGTQDTSGTVPVVDRLEFGQRASAVFLNGYIRRIAFYPRRLSNDQLRGITV
jgi:hypothetical protein